MKDTVGSFDIGSSYGQYQFGLVTLDSNVTAWWDLTTYKAAPEIWNATDNVTSYSSITNTKEIHLGIDEMVAHSFREYEARPIQDGHPRIGIVVTYRSTAYQFSDELMYVSDVREFDSDVNRIAVGIGNNGN